MRVLVFSGSEWSKSMEVDACGGVSLAAIFGAPATLFQNPDYPDVTAWALRSNVDCANGYALMESLGFVSPNFPRELRRGTVVFVSKTPPKLDVLDLMAWRMQAFDLKPNCDKCMRDMLRSGVK